MTKEELDQMVVQILEVWSRQMTGVLMAQLSKRKIYLSGRLMQSLKQDVFNEAGAGTQMMLLSFLDHGRMADMRNLMHKKMPDVAEIEDFVERIMYDGSRLGRKPFEYVPGYKHGQFPLDASKAMNRIAWGVAMSMKGKNRSMPRPWFNKPFYGMLNKLTDELITKYADSAMKKVKGDLTKLY